MLQRIKTLPPGPAHYRQLYYILFKIYVFLARGGRYTPSGVLRNTRPQLSKASSIIRYSNHSSICMIYNHK